MGARCRPSSTSGTRHVRVVDRVYDLLIDTVKVAKFHDDTSTTRNQNLNAIVNWHNKQSRDLDVSVHFNAFDIGRHGTEVLYCLARGAGQDGLRRYLSLLGIYESWGEVQRWSGIPEWDGQAGYSD